MGKRHLNEYGIHQNNGSSILVVRAIIPHCVKRSARVRRCFGHCLPRRHCPGTFSSNHLALFFSTVSNLVFLFFSLGCFKHLDLDMISHSFGVMYMCGHGKYKATITYRSVTTCDWVCQKRVNPSRYMYVWTRKMPLVTKVAQLIVLPNCIIVHVCRCM